MPVTAVLPEDTAPATEDVSSPFRRATGQQYYRFLKGLHRDILVDWYLEVGSRTGQSLGPVRAKSIAVDPFFAADANIIGAKPRLHVFQSTSDDFFASDFLKKNGVQLSFSFLDGMHLCEYLLRDVIGAEANSHPGGVIALHDCCPFSEGMTTRDLSNLPRGAWTGDVWKLIPILQKHRPDITITVLDCKPTGLVLLSNLTPKNRVLKTRYDKIVAEWAEIELASYGIERFYDCFTYTDPVAFAADGYPLFDAVRLDPALGLAPVPVTK